MSDKEATFGEQLAEWVSAVSIVRMALGRPMTDMEIASALIAILARVLTSNSDEEYRAVALQAAHESLDALCKMAGGCPSDLSNITPVGRA